MGNSVSTIILARNSAKTISKAIKSVENISSQVIVLDTGSEDDTPEICSRLGGEVHFYRWNNSFSDARNYALKLVRNDWVLVLDSDEELDAVSFERHKYLLENEQIGGVSVIIKNFLAGDLISEHKYTRLFRADRRFYFKGRVHEQISASIQENGYDVVGSGIVLYHYGYEQYSPERYERNKALLELDLLENPEDDYIKYHLAETEFGGLKFTEAEELFRELLASFHLSTRQMEFVKLRLAQISLKKDDYLKARNYLDFVSDDLNIEGFRKYLLSVLYLLEKNFPVARRLLIDEMVLNSCLVNKNDLEKLLRLIGNEVKM